MNELCGSMTMDLHGRRAAPGPNRQAETRSSDRDLPMMLTKKVALLLFMDLIPFHSTSISYSSRHVFAV